MARIKTIKKNSFSTGVVDESFLERFDLAIFPGCAKTIENCTISSYGPVKRRPGQQYIATIANGTNLGLRMESFVVDTTNSYLLLFSDGKFDVYKNDTFQVSVSSSPISTLTAAQITSMRVLQVEDTMILVHEDVQPIKITRTNDTTWVTAYITFEDVPYKAFGTTYKTSPNATLTPESFTSGRGVKFNASSGVFSSSHVGQAIVFKNGALAIIRKYNSSTEILADIKVSLPSTAAIASGQWELETGFEQVMSSTKGWPSCIAFENNRLFLSGFKNAKQVVLGSSVEKGIFNFDTGIAGPSDAINVEIVSQEQIQDIAIGGGLFVLTKKEVFALPSGSNPTNITAKQCSDVGISSTNTINVAGSTVYVDSDSASVQRLKFDYRVNNFESKPITLYSSDHLSNPSRLAVAPATGERNEQLLYIVNASGNLSIANVFFDGQVDQFAWSTFTTDGTYKDVCVVGSEIYFLVQRTINATATMFLEKSQSSLQLDCAKSVTVSSATTSFTGFNHLDGQSVAVIGDDYVLENATPSSGAVTISKSSSNAELGFSFLAKLEPPQILSDGDGRSFQFKPKRLVHVFLSMVASTNIVVQFNSVTFKSSLAQLGDVSADTARFTGQKKFFISGSATHDAVVTLTQTEPHPFEIASIEMGFK